MVFKLKRISIIYLIDYILSISGLASQNTVKKKHFIICKPWDDGMFVCVRLFPFNTTDFIILLFNLAQTFRVLSHTLDVNPLLAYQSVFIDLNFFWCLPVC